MTTRRISRASTQKRVKCIPKRAMRRKSRQLPHILKHFTFVIICLSIFLLILASVFHSTAPVFDAIVLLSGCAVIDGIALLL
jgi:hypothetical protein